MNNQLKWALAIILIAIAIAAVMIWSRPVPQKEERITQAPLVETIALKIASGAIPLTVSGTVQPRNEVVIAAQVSGRLTYVSPNFREGSFVPGNAVLLRIDPADYQNRVRIARADVAAQDVAVLEAREQMAIARDDLARYAERERQLAAAPDIGQETGGTSRILPPEALNRQNIASSNASNSKGSQNARGVGATPSGLASREPQLRSARAARERAAASLADAQLSLSRTRITAPFGGLVSAENAAIGTFVQTGQSLGTVVGTNAYDVRLSMTQDEAALIPGLLQGKAKNIRADIIYDYGGQRYRWTAFVDRANASLDSTTRNVEVFVRVPNPLTGGRLAQDDAQESAPSPALSPAPSSNAPPLLIGAFVEAQIAGAPQGQYAAIPSSALRPGNEIWLVRDGRLQIVPVRVIRRGEKLAYIAADALVGGGRLVTSSLSAPTNNMPVRLASDAVK